MNWVSISVILNRNPVLNEIPWQRMLKMGSTGTALKIHLQATVPVPVPQISNAALSPVTETPGPPSSLSYCLSQSCNQEYGCHDFSPIPTGFSKSFPYFSPRKYRKNKGLIRDFSKAHAQGWLWREVRGQRVRSYWLGFFGGLAPSLGLWLELSPTMMAEIRKKQSQWPGSQSAPRLYNGYNLCLCARPAHVGKCWPGS